MSTRSEPFLWIHLGGIIMFPLMLAIALIGLGVGQRYSYFIEFPLLIVITILPILGMQLYRPFNIFSILFFALEPEVLTQSQRKILALFRRKQQKVVNVMASGLMILNLFLLYNFSSGTFEFISLLPQQRIFGLAIACLALFAGNLFFQIPLNAFQVLLTNELKLAQIKQCSLQEIVTNFTTPGIKLSKIPGLSSTKDIQEIN